MQNNLFGDILAGQSVCSDVSVGSKASSLQVHSVYSDDKCVVIHTVGNGTKDRMYNSEFSAIHSTNCGSVKYDASPGRHCNEFLV